jgi:hypothetical protein
MKATIGDIRKGDRFTWGSKTYIAFDDARPVITGIANDDYWQRFSNIFMISTAAIAPAEDGSYHQESRNIDCQSVLTDKTIEIHERDRTTVCAWEEPDSTDKPVDEQHTRIKLENIMHARKQAQRLAEDVDQTRDHYIRRALKGGSSVAQLMEITGLSRARIYQIRDGRR